ncbi:hypothetical protein ACQJBY_042861 [Aegilops geniculata]
MPKEKLRKGGGEIIDLHGVIAVGVRAGDVGVDFVSCIQLRSSLTMRMLSMLSSPSTQARCIVVIPTRGSPTCSRHPSERQQSSKFKVRPAGFGGDPTEEIGHPWSQNKADVKETLHMVFFEEGRALDVERELPDWMVSFYCLCQNLFISFILMQIFVRS